MNINELCHRWANQTHPSAVSGNVSFDGLKLTSYRTVIAQILPTRQGGKVCVFTSRSHSNSSSKQKHLAHRAWGYENPSLSFDFGDRGNYGVQVDAKGYPTKDTLTKWGVELRERAKVSASKMSRARTFADLHLRDLMGCIADAEKLVNYWGGKNALPKIEGEDVKAFVSRLAEATAKAWATAKARANRDENKRLKQLREAIAQWQAGERSSLPHTSEIFLRLVTEESGREVVETSWGATVLLKDAARLFSICAACHKNTRELHTVEGFEPLAKVGPYTLIAIDADGNATVGCHRLSFAEMSRLAHLIGEDKLTAARKEGGQ